MVMMKCKVFEETKVHQPSIGNIRYSAAWNFNVWSAETNYEIESVESHADMNGEVKSIVVFYEEPDENENKVV